MWVRTFFLHAGQDLHVGDVVELVRVRGAHGVLVHLGGAQLAVHGRLRAQGGRIPLGRRVPLVNCREKHIRRKDERALREQRSARCWRRRVIQYRHFRATVAA